jgi:hypothetical protein
LSISLAYNENKYFKVHGSGRSYGKELCNLPFAFSKETCKLIIFLFSQVKFSLLYYWQSKEIAIILRLPIIQEGKIIINNT